MATDSYSTVGYACDPIYPVVVRAILFSPFFGKGWESKRLYVGTMGSIHYRRWELGLYGFVPIVMSPLDCVRLGPLRGGRT